MVTATFDMATLTAELTVDEGNNRFPYSDTRGYWTIGRGRNLSGKGLSDDEIDYLFANDVAECAHALDANVPWWRGLPPGKQRVMLNLCFNLGWGGLAGFHLFLSAMRLNNWPLAARELIDSIWYREVGTRGPRVVGRLLASDPESATS